MSAGAASTGSRILDDLAEVIGEQAALDLALAYRGEALYVPKDPATDPGLAAAIGAEAAAHLCEAFYRTTIYMPFTEALARKVRQLDEAGVTRKAIGRQLHIPERRVYRILESSRDDTRQLPLL